MARRGRSARLAAATVIVSVLIWVAIATTGPASATAPGGALGLVLVSTQAWVGDDVVIFELYDADGRPIPATGATVTLDLVGPAGETLDDVPAGVARFATSGRDLFAARARLASVGTWRLTANVTRQDWSGTAEAAIDVLADDGTPPLGGPAPAVATPVLGDVGNLMAAITSDPEPVSAFYMTRVDTALAEGLPFVLVLDSDAFRPNEACGGALGILHDIFFEYPALTVIHAEPWRMAFREGVLGIEPPGGPAVLADWSVAWGATEPPWVFVVDDAGRLRAKFQGVFGTDELRAAMAEVSLWQELQR